MTSWLATGEKLSPVFPPELEREIFETTAERYPETIYKPCLLLVAKRVHEWIEWIKYRTITSAEPTQACPLRLLRNALYSNLKPADFFHNRVRHLAIDEADVPVGEAQLILSACSGIRSLELSYSPGPSILPSLEIMKPRRLSVSLEELFNGIDAIELLHPVFSFVTHLEAIDSASYFESNDFPWGHFAVLPALTHLSFIKNKQSTAMKILANCPKLEVLVSVGYFDDTQELSCNDARLVCVELKYDGWLDDWLAGTKGDVDFWVRAERFVAKKRRGEIQPSSRCWIEDGDGI